MGQEYSKVIDNGFLALCVDQIVFIEPNSLRRGDSLRLSAFKGAFIKQLCVRLSQRSYS